MRQQRGDFFIGVLSLSLLGRPRASRSMHIWNVGTLALSIWLRSPIVASCLGTLTISQYFRCFSRPAAIVADTVQPFGRLYGRLRTRRGFG
jgi:hypothetical protein